MECFGTFARGEAADLMRISRTTLTFTLTYRAVNTLVEHKQRHMALLGIGVCAIIFISKSIAHFAATTTSFCGSPCGFLERLDSLANCICR